MVRSAGEAGRRALDQMVLGTLLFGREQLAGDPHQGKAAGQHEARQVEDVDDEDRHDGAHGDGAEGAPEDHLALGVLGQVAGDQADDQGVVARQHEVDQDDSEQRRHEAGRQEVEFHGSLQQKRTFLNGGLFVRDVSAPSLRRAGRPGAGP
jgi:hypothetical protein